MIKAIKVNKKDNVAILLEDISKNSFCSFNNIKKYKANQNIPFGHKIALFDISIGENIVKYGYPIGYATKYIKKGDWVHIHNIECARGRFKNNEDLK